MLARAQEPSFLGTVAAETRGDKQRWRADMCLALGVLGPRRLRKGEASWDIDRMRAG